MDQNEATKRFYDVIWPHRSDVLRVAQFMCRDSWVADDLAQETLMKAFGALRKTDIAEVNLKSWLLTILRNTWRDRLRSGRAEEDIDALAEEPEGRQAADNAGDSANPQSLMEAFSDQQVIEALKALPDEIRWTLLLVDVEEMSVHEAAEILQVPGGTVKSRAHRGRQMLRQTLLPLAPSRRLVEESVNVAKDVSLRQEEL